MYRVDIGYVYSPYHTPVLKYGRGDIMGHDIYHDINWWNITKDFLHLAIL